MTKTIKKKSFCSSLQLEEGFLFIFFNVTILIYVEKLIE